jgi:putative ABC transport system permease protein
MKLSPDMLKNYLRLSVRSILSQGKQSIVSAIGLSVALSSSILILLYVQYEFSYDRYHEHAGRIYRIITKQEGHSYMGSDRFAVTAGPLKEAIVNEIPEIKYSTKCKVNSHTLEYNGALFSESGFLYTDTDFLKIFTFPVIAGNQSEALKEPFALFLTREMASKYFGDDDPVGKIILADNKYAFTVRGILEDVPPNSHFDFDFLTGFETLYSMRGGKENVENWSSNSYITYFLLAENTEPETVKSKLDDLYTKYTKSNPHLFKVNLVPEPLNHIHLGGKINFEPGNNSDIRYIYLIISIGILIMLVACFNYMNMATARSINRGREIGVLKVSGSSRRDLIIQFLTESVLLSMGGLVLALLIVLVVLPVFSDFTDRPLNFRMILEIRTMVIILAIMLSAGLLSGSYPAFHLASFSPLSLLRADFKNNNSRSGSLKNILIVLQYAISIVALISAFTVVRQLKFINNSDLGFVKENIITANLRDPALRRNPQFLISELVANPDILHLTTSDNLPVTISSNSRGNWEGKPSDCNPGFYQAGIGDNFIDFYNLKIIAGRGFSNDFSTDTVNRFIINETAAKVIGWNDPVGQKFSFNQHEGIIIGVIKDFHFHSLHLPVEPLVLSAIGSEEFREVAFISIKVQPGSISEASLFIEKKLKELSPHYINQLSIFSDRVDKMYISDRKLAAILLFSTILALILTCLGQYSLTSYTTKRRTREMAIRKVMGLHPAGIMAMLAIEMARWIFVSLIFAWPTGYILMNRWLQNFAYHVNPGAAVFLYSLIFTTLVSAIAISYHVIRLSTVNPAVMIRHE